MVRWLTHEYLKKIKKFKKIIKKVKIITKWHVSMI